MPKSSVAKKIILRYIDVTKSFAFTWFALLSLARYQQNKMSTASGCEGGSVASFYSHHGVLLEYWTHVYAVHADHVYQTAGACCHQGIQPRAQLCFTGWNLNSLWRELSEFVNAR